MKKDLLIEIGTEELPASVILPALRFIEDKLSEILSAQVRSFGTPRRLVFFVKDLKNAREVIEETVYGPPWNVAFDEEGKPTKALEGFLKRHGFSDKEVFKAKKGKGFYVAVKLRKEGKTPIERLKDSFEDLLLEVPFPKRMRWTSSKTVTFSRPVRWILALFGKDTVDLKFGNVRADRRTYGHRILHPHPVEIGDPQEYFEKIKELKVLVSFDERRELIERLVISASREERGAPEYPEGLMDEVANLVEYPFSVKGEFDKKFLELPEKVVVTVLAHHQRFFCIKRDGKLINKFVGISNNEDRKGNIKKGYERVVKARLEDALFFYREDLKKRLDDLVPLLSGVLIHPKVGNMLEKVKRMEIIAERIAKVVGADPGRVSRAVLLSKTDLLTEMVKEFDELQGYMGYIYARNQGEDEEVSRAIYEQYKPAGFQDEVPSTKTGTVLSLADKIDHVYSFFSAGEIPKGSSDPFGLRRAVFGIIKILDLKAVDLDLEEFREFYPDFDIDLLKSFFAQRLETYLEEAGYDVVRAVLEVESPLRPYEVAVKVRAISQIRETPMLRDIYEAYRRVVRILPEGWSKEEVKEELLLEDAEARLWEKINELKEGEITLTDLAELRKYIDELFDKVMIMDERKNLRENRLALLLKTKKLFNRFADFSRLVIS